MAYYIGFLKQSKKHAVVFRSIIKPKRSDLTYFLRVIGPYSTEEGARRGLRLFKSEGYSENPVKGSISKKDIIRAVGLMRKVKKIYGIIRKKNPGESYHDQKFMQYLKELEKYVIGSAPYISTLAKAYEHLQSARDSQRERMG